jgi:hypothetical protein
MVDAPKHPYLEGARCIPADLLGSERFLGKIKIDSRGNAVFPHFDADGLTGYELKNRGFTGFASGGTKAIWISNANSVDDCLVFCESAIDALSYAALFPDNQTSYASVGGKPSSAQQHLIRAAVAQTRGGSEITAAMDADAEGQKLAELVRQAVAMSGRDDLKFQSHAPDGFKDWNDQLRAQSLLSRPLIARDQAADTIVLTS